VAKRQSLRPAQVPSAQYVFDACQLFAVGLTN
jgi:hypothetical protein